MTSVAKKTVTVLDDFYSFKIDVQAEEYDIASSFFNSVFSDQETARSFTATLFRVAAETGEEPISILDRLSGKDQLELSFIMAFYLNKLRSLTALLGVEAEPSTNFYAARNALP